MKRGITGGVGREGHKIKRRMARGMGEKGTMRVK
jgi:hypothetical protein